MLRTKMNLIGLVVVVTMITTCSPSAIVSVDDDDFINHYSKLDTIHNTIYDTIRLGEHNKHFDTFDDIVLFATYVKTQSNQLDDDNWSVIHTLFNRLDEEQCTWREYFYRPSINHSATIKKLLNGTLEVDFSLKRTCDLALVERTINAYLGHNPTNVPCNVLYFESFKKSPNRGVFIKKNIWRKYRHKFYTGTLKSN